MQCQKFKQKSLQKRQHDRRSTIGKAPAPKVKCYNCFRPLRVTGPFAPTTMSVHSRVPSPMIPLRLRIPSRWGCQRSPLCLPFADGLGLAPDSDPRSFVRVSTLRNASAQRAAEASAKPMSTRCGGAPPRPTDIRYSTTCAAVRPIRTPTVAIASFPAPDKSLSTERPGQVSAFRHPSPKSIKKTLHPNLGHPNLGHPNQG